MKIKPITINGNESTLSFQSCQTDGVTVLVGGYIITPRGEIIVVDESAEHCNVFSAYINEYLEQQDLKIYDTGTAIKILCELGCCVYSRIRYKEYISSRTGNLDDEALTLAFPKEIEEITLNQKEICKKIIESNKSLLGDREKFYMAYESFPGIVYIKEQILSILNSKQKVREQKLKENK